METFLLPLNICYYIFSFIHAYYGHQAVIPVGILLVYDAIALNHFFTAKIVFKKGREYCCDPNKCSLQSQTPALQ